MKGLGVNYAQAFLN